MDRHDGTHKVRGGPLRMAALALLLTVALRARAEGDTPAVIELRFTPAERAQIAIWLERANGAFVTTARLTEAVAKRGIGNRPGASQMNSGFRWPYGRREGVLPIWATRRATSAGSEPFRRVIFQDRTSEGNASRSSRDYSRDDYFCLSFNGSRARRDALDAVSCASVFNSDKGRFVTQADLDGGYAEPYERLDGQGLMRPLSLTSLYPPRSDIVACDPALGECFDHPDAASFDAHVRTVMPEIDAVTMATPTGGVAQSILYAVPASWPAGAYRVCLEINTEGDYNDAYDDAVYPTPRSPSAQWDKYALSYGYAYRGQPSVVYCAPIELGSTLEQTAAVLEPEGSAGAWDFEDSHYGELQPMDGLSDDPTGAPGSGADRLRLREDGTRLSVTVRPPATCADDQPPSALEQLRLEPHPDRLHAHQWARLSFAAAADDRGVARYEVRVSTAPIVDDASFMAALPAKQATQEAQELLVPADRPAGEPIQVEIGGLVASTRYFIAARAMDGCTQFGPLRVAELTTPAREFQTVTPCFVATAAYGDPLARRIGVLRRARDRYLRSNLAGRALVSAYERLGPELAAVIREREWLRGATRAALAPWVAIAERLAE